VDVRSDGEGRGSTVTVTLPKLHSGASNSAPATAGLPPAASRLRVFVVDDNADAGEMLAMLVEGLGHTALVEMHSSRALERIVDERPDVCLLDVGMPDLDGHALARAITARMQLAPVLVAITGYSQPHDRAKSLGAGFTEHFANPVDSVALAKLLASISRHD